MPEYRRAFVPGGTFFFTVVTYERRPILTSDDALETLRQAFDWTRVIRPFTVEAIVILPDHLHCIWTLPANDADFAVRWRSIKSRFTRNIVSKIDARSESPSRVARRERPVWQRRYWEHNVRDERDFRRHVEYIHANPVRHGLGLRARLAPFELWAMGDRWNVRIRLVLFV